MSLFDRFHGIFNPSPHLKSAADVGAALEEWFHFDPSELALILPWTLFWLVKDPDSCNVEPVQVSMLVDHLNIGSIDGEFTIDRQKLQGIEKINARRMLDIYDRLNDKRLTMLRDLVLTLKPIAGAIFEDDIDASVLVIDLLIVKRKEA